MEKRLLLAFLLSFVVLSSWTALNPPPAKHQQNILQDLENKKVDDKQPQDLFASSPLTSPVTPKSKPAAKEENVILKNNMLRLELSNIGGTIKTIVLSKYDYTFPVSDVVALPGFSHEGFSLVEQGSDRVVFYLSLPEQDMYKEYRLGNGYEVDAKVRIVKKMSRLDISEINVLTLDTSRLDEKALEGHQKSLYEYSIGFPSRIYRKGNAFEFSQKDNKKEATAADWFGFRDQYFCSVAKPEFKTSGYEVKETGKHVLSILTSPDSDGNLQSNELNFTWKLYLGPQKLHILSEYNQGFEKIMAFSGMAIIDSIAKGIYLIFHFLYKYINNWGICIVLLGMLIFGATYPLTIKGMSSTKKMQALQPEMKALQDKYKSDPQRLNRELAQLYKDHGVNPFGGCLLLFIQMPIFFALYQVLWRSVDFKGASFLWIKDLSQPDHLIILPVKLPYIGNEINLLPFIMMVIMFIQQKVSAKNMVITDPAQLTQQKMMVWFFPIFLGFIFYKFASGLALYFTVFYVLSTLAQWQMSKMNLVKR